MPETIRALIVLLPISAALLFFHRRALPTTISTADFKLLASFYFSFILIAFMSNNYWLFILLIACFVQLQSPKEPVKKLYLFIFLLPALPILAHEIPGFVGIRYIIELNYPRALALLLLLPLFIRPIEKERKFFKQPGDKLFAAYLLLVFILSFRMATVTAATAAVVGTAADTGAIGTGIGAGTALGTGTGTGTDIGIVIAIATGILRSNFYLFVDVFLIYYVSSRYLRKFKDFQFIAYTLLLAATLLGGLAIFGSLKGWNLFGSLNSGLDINQRFSSYLVRDGVLRASGPFSGPITMGMFLNIGMGMGLAIVGVLRKYKIFFFGSLFIALILTVSRGPWVGMLVLAVTYLFCSRNKRILIPRLLQAFLLIIPLFVFTPFGNKMIDTLPFIGNSNTATVSYRQQLFDKSWIVIQQHPLFGSVDYKKTPELQSMKQGQGIIDLVNSYIIIALNSGLVGVGLFISFFALLLIKLYRLQKKIPKEYQAEHQYSICLIATLFSTLVVIATVSPVDIVAHLYWLLGGIASAYIIFLQKLLQKGPPNNEVDISHPIPEKP